MVILGGWVFLISEVPLYPRQCHFETSGGLLFDVTFEAPQNPAQEMWRREPSHDDSVGKGWGEDSEEALTSMRGWGWGRALDELLCRLLSRADDGLSACHALVHRGEPALEHRAQVPLALLLLVVAHVLPVLGGGHGDLLRVGNLETAHHVPDSLAKLCSEIFAGVQCGVQVVLNLWCKGRCFSPTLLQLDPSVVP